MIRSNTILYRTAFLILLCLLTKGVFAQSNLSRNISINVKQMKLADLLTEIGKKGKFYFSYSSDMIRADSLVTLFANNKTIRALLDELFTNNMAYKEAPGYIILRPAPNRLILVPDTTENPENNFIISGFVVDDLTGKKIQNASVYEKRLLTSTLTDEHGFFRLKLKASGVITLTVSKEMYKDTSVSFLSKVTISLKSDRYIYNPDTGSHNTERSWLGRLFISSKMKVQAINIGEFISGVPVQTSFLPGLGSHGLMSGQIVNHFSFNLLGGYNAGVAGVEIGGLYNLNKLDVKYLQAAGLFNVVGGSFTGIQMAGINNIVYKNVNGVQAAGLFNRVGQNTAGLQVAGIANITGKAATGLQVAGLVNHAQLLKGVHIALFNVADTLEGYAINLMSFSRNGYHQLSVYTDENSITTLAFKTGNARLYTKLIGGINFIEATKYYTYGIGFGHDVALNKRLSLSTEFTAQFIESPQWNNMHQLDRFSTFLNISVSSKLLVFFGPSLNLYDRGQNNTLNEQEALIKNKIGLTSIGQSFKTWVGWSAGVTLF